MTNAAEQALAEEETRAMHAQGFYIVTAVHWKFTRAEAEQACNRLNRSDRRRSAHFVVSVTEVK